MDLQESRLSGSLVQPERMSPLRLAVVGLGALGSEVARILALCGAGDLLLIDPDRIESSNLSRSTLYGPADIGRLKAEVLVQRLRERCTNICLHGLTEEIADTGWGLLEHRHLIFCCVDRDSARLETARISTRLGVPMCDGGLGGPRAELGRVSYFPGKDGACFCCRLTSARRRELLAEWQSQPHPCGGPESDPVRASTPIIASVAAGFTVDSGLRALGTTEAFSIDIHLGLHPELHRLSLVQSADCPFHNHAESPLRPVPTTFAEALAGCESLRWEWPICTAAKCLACGHQWTPNLRVARLRTSSCPACKQSGILALESLQSITSHSPQVHQSPESLGLPPHHLFF